MPQRIAIEDISTGHSDFHCTEFVVLANKSQEKIYLDDWKIVWCEVPSQRVLHEYTFTKWAQKPRSFDPNEKLFLIGGHGFDKCFQLKESRDCLLAHWRVFTDTWKYICSVPHIKVSLVDPLGVEVDHLYSHQYRQQPKEQPSIVIGHGRNPAWKELKDFLHDQLGFAVEAFETEPRASETIPQVITNLGAGSNMAILILTGEDLTAEGTLNPRLNVAQELGKFQERFGCAKTLILVEEGTTVPSNNSGIVQIRFEPGQIINTFGPVVATIKREFALW